MTNIVTLHKAYGLPMAKEICHSVNSDLVFGCDDPLGDPLIAIEISKALDAKDILDE